MNANPSNENPVDRAQRVLQDLLRLIGQEGAIQPFVQNDGETLLHIETPEPGRLIGRNAQVLNALQLILNRMVLDRDGHSPHFVVDVERYRERQRDRLVQEALEAAERVAQTGRPVRLRPMSAAERRIVHQALKNRAGVETHSEVLNPDGDKQVVVCPASAPPAADAAPAEPPPGDGPDAAPPAP